MTDVNNAHMIQARIIWRLYEEFHYYNVNCYGLFKSMDDVIKCHPDKYMQFIHNLTDVLCNRLNRNYRVKYNINPIEERKIKL